MFPEWAIRASLAAGLILLGWVSFRAFNTLLVRSVRQKSPRLAGLLPGTAAVVYFTTPDCAACKAAQRPALMRLQQMLGREKLQIIEINAYEKPELAKEWGVLSVPTTFILDARGAARQVNHGVTRAEKLMEQLQGI